MPVWEPRMLSILRIMAGLLFMEHGMGKLFGFPPAAMHPAFPACCGLPASWNASAARWSRLVCSPAWWHSCCPAKWPSATSWRISRRASSRC